HEQDKAFTDGLPVGVGVTDQAHTVGPMSLTNVAYATTLGWANPLMDSLEKQALVPMFGEEPVELGLSVLSEEEFLDRFRNHPDYPARFAAAFGGEDPITVPNLVQALASFERALISGNSPYDRFTYAGEDDALSDSARRGMFLFFSERVECFHCHGGFNFSDSTSHEGTVFTETPFHNNGLYNVGGEGRYPDNQGVYEITQEPNDMGRFKAPTLRNIALTAPYMHDGSIATLEEVIEHYARGGRLITEGENAGDGAQHPNKSEFVPGFILTDQEKEDMLNFLHSLTDEQFVTNPDFSNPFTSAE
ncbi:MAG: MbnH family di-heme enzyme, partial [Myxococcota bacterium]